MKIVQSEKKKFTFKDVEVAKCFKTLASDDVYMKLFAANCNMGGSNAVRLDNGMLYVFKSLDVAIPFNGTLVEDYFSEK